MQTKIKVNKTNDMNGSVDLTFKDMNAGKVLALLQALATYPSPVAHDVFNSLQHALQSVNLVEAFKEPGASYIQTSLTLGE